MRYYSSHKTMAKEASEIYRMNKLLEIEQTDWQRQLDQAVSVPRGSYHCLV